MRPTEKKIFHVPVTITPEDRKMIYQGKSLGWWNKDALMPYNSLLMSAYFGMDMIKTREDMGCPEEVLFFGDSGGYQLLSMGLKDEKKYAKLSEKLTPKNVIEWQQDICDIGMTLDIPLPRENVNSYTPSMYRKHLDISKKNAWAMREMHTNKKFHLFNCVHGSTFHDMVQWKDECEEGHDYDGYSLSTSSTIKKLLSLRLGFAQEFSTGKPYHLLGVSSLQNVLLIAYANKYTKTTVYFDSSSSAAGRMYRKYINFYDLGGGGINLVEEHDKYLNMEGFTCPCPVCSQLVTKEDMWAKKTLSGVLITLHNLYWMGNFTEFANQLVHDDEAFDSFVRRNCQPWVKESMNFLDDVHDIGLEDAYNRHFFGSSQQIEEWL